MKFITGKWGFFAIGVIVGGTLLANRVGSLPVLNKIPKL